MFQKLKTRGQVHHAYKSHMECVYKSSRTNSYLVHIRCLAKNAHTIGAEANVKTAAEKITVSILDDAPIAECARGPIFVITIDDDKYVGNAKVAAFVYMTIIEVFVGCATV